MKDMLRNVERVGTVRGIKFSVVSREQAYCAVSLW